MLKLPRVKGERLIIGEDSAKIILEHFGYSIKNDGSIEIMLGITAPNDFEISTSSGIYSKPTQQHNSNDRRQGKKLLIARNVGDKVHIGESVSVLLAETAGSKVFFGIDAPRHIRVMREELLT